MSYALPKIIVRHLSRGRWPGIHTAKALSNIKAKQLSLNLGIHNISSHASTKNELAGLIRMYNREHEHRIDREEVCGIVRNMGTVLGLNELAFLHLDRIDIARFSLDIHKYSKMFHHLFIKHTHLTHLYGSYFDVFRTMLNSARTAEQKGYVFLLLSYLIWKHDKKTWIHHNEVRIIFSELMKLMRLRDRFLPGTKILEGELAAHEHDCGKLYLSKRLLHKKHPTAKEFEKIRNTHVILGVALFKHIAKMTARVIKYILFHHHNRQYPAEIIGKIPPFIALVINVADSFHAMLTRARFPLKKTIETLMKKSENYDQSIVMALKILVGLKPIEVLMPASAYSRRKERRSA